MAFETDLFIISTYVLSSSQEILYPGGLFKRKLKSKICVTPFTKEPSKTSHFK